MIVRAFLTAALLCGPLVLGLAQTQVQYFEGACELQVGNDWKSVNFGDRLDSTTQVRLGADALLVIDTQGSTVTVSRPGSYKVADLVRDSKTASSKGLGSVINKKIELVARTPPKAKAAVGGVRAGVDNVFDTVTWVDSKPPEVRMAEAQKAMAARDIRRAREALDAAVYESFPEERDDLVYLIGLNCADAGYPALAVGYVARHTVVATSKRYEDYILLKSRILYESLNYNEAVAYCQSLDSAKITTKSQQLLGVVEALSERALGQETQAKQRFEAAIQLAPTSDEAKLAEKLKAGT